MHLEAVPARTGADLEYAPSSKIDCVLEFLDDVGDRRVYPGRVFACPEFIPDCS